MPSADSIRRLVSRILIGTTLILTPLSGVHAAAPMGQILIGEVAWAGSSASTADEWVELWNTGSTDVSLAGYSLQGGSDKPIFLSATATIPAKGTYLIANYADIDTKSALGVSVQSVTTTISLSNSTLGLSLRDGSNLEVDHAGTGGLPPAGFSSTTKATMIRIGDGWTNATTSMGFDAGRTDLGTPGTCDGCAPDTVPPVIEPIPAPAPEPEPTPVIPTSTEPVAEPTPEPVATSTAPTEQISPVEPTTTSTEETTAPANTPEVLPTVPAEEPIPVPTFEPAPTSPTEEVIPSIEAPTPVEEAPVVETPSTTEAAPVVTTTPNVTSTAAEPTPASSPQATSPTPTTSAAPEPTHYENLRLNEIMPNPESGSEWVELTGVDLDAAIPLQGITLYDATGKIATIATGTLDLTTPFIRITLSSSRLNNDGDTVSIHAPTGELMDGLTYTYSEKGNSWIRIPDATGGWKVTLEPTPGDTNTLVEEAPAQVPTSVSTSASTATPVATSQTSSPAPVSSPTPTATASSLTPATIQVTPSKPVTTTPPASSAAPKTTTVKPVAPKAKTTTTTPKATAKTASKTATTTKATAPKKAPTTKKTTAPKTTPLPTSITHAMANLESNAGIPVALTGTVGTPAGLLSGHYFILLSEDGRGLKVHVPTSRKLPNTGESVRVVGILSFSDEGIPSLGMRKDDPLETAKSLPFPQPRLVDLMSPSLEDAWSLVQVTGTVTAIKGQTVSLDLGDADINMVVKSSIGYRVSRLKVGDRIRVRALVQLGDVAPELLPRSADDIEIVGHINIVPSTTQSSSLPGWTPFAAAGAAVAGTEGLKRMRESYKKYKLEKRLRTGLNTPEPSLA
jgi:hypothetical protein